MSTTVLEKSDREPITVSENVTVFYKDGKISIRGTSITVSIDIPSKELQAVYFKGQGRGKLTVEIDPE